MSKIFKIEKFIFYALVFLLFFQSRVILHSFRPEFNEWTSVYLYLTDLLIAAVILLWLARNYKKLRWVNLRHALRLPEIILGIFLLISVLSIVASNNISLSFYSFAKIFEMAIFFVYVNRNFSQLFNLERFWQIFIASASVQSVVAISQFFLQRSLGIKYLESPLSPDIAGVAKIVVSGEKYIRAYGLVPHPNILAAFLILAIFGLAYLFVKKYAQLLTWQKVIYGAVFILISLALFFTFSRAVTAIGLVFLTIWLVILFWRPACRRGRQKEYRRPIIIFVILLLIVNCLLLAVYWPYFSSRYDLSAVGQSQSLDLRVYYNQIAFGFIEDSPIFGIGQGNFVWANSNLGLLESWMYQPAHNIYLLIGAEIGILGLAFFVWFLLALWWRAKKALVAPANCLIYIFCFIITVGFIDHFWWDLQQGQILFWLFLGIFASFSLSPHSLTDKARPSGG